MQIPQLSRYSSLLRSTAERLRLVLDSVAEIHLRIARVQILPSDSILLLRLTIYLQTRLKANSAFLAGGDSSSGRLASQ
jgi:hypothetical protein